MKTITRILLVVSLAVFAACEGPVGPPGPPGLDGEDGLNGENGYLFEIEGTFSEANDYALFFPFPDDFKMYNTDIVMVYILWDQVESTTGELLDVWRPLPQTVVFQDGGVIQYNFDYTVGDVNIFIQETVGELLPAETDNQVFRIAVLPADFVATKSIDVNNLDAVMKTFSLNEKSVKKISIEK
ncbi:hypothetical protein ACRTDU_15790 [Sunxiuqinia elliptica]|uniref:Collagen-like protein n=1 Tax=Sunxiuqinia elliptica TaxID=655355 RepID=A0A1I2C873_9BACT|nr:hypothetical protein [Sunxiuqinia elliptica]SFE64517.1 hypothetical protein SAMN05216283_101641 [Sunxiuqinia elliptica]